MRLGLDSLLREQTFFFFFLKVLLRGSYAKCEEGFWCNVKQQYFQHPFALYRPALTLLTLTNQFSQALHHRCR